MHDDVLVTCPFCTEDVYESDFNHASNECNECHDAADYPMDECGCERCLDSAIAKIDFMD